MSAPTLSILMPNYNHARFIPEALDAILAQSYRPLEIIVLDDGSSDDSVEIAESYQRREPTLIRLVRNPSNRGILANTGRLLTMARGDFVFFSAMDDLILPGFLERSMHLLARYPEAGVSSTLSRTMDDDGTPRGNVKMPIVLGRDGFIPPGEIVSVYREHGNWFMGNTTIYRRATLEAIGGFRADLGPYCDAFASLVIAARHGACYVPAALAAWRKSNKTFSYSRSLNFEASLTIVQAAESVMRTHYSAEFPDSFIREWRNEFLYGITTFAGIAAPRQLSSMRHHVYTPTRLDKMVFELAHFMPPAASPVSKAYFFLRFKRGQFWRMLRRRLAHLQLSSATA